MNQHAYAVLGSINVLPKRQEKMQIEQENSTTLKQKKTSKF